jgi:Ca2+/Na+ antiporter
MYISVAYIIVYVTILYYKNKPEVVSSVALYTVYIYIYWIYKGKYKHRSIEIEAMFVITTSTSSA